MSGGSSRRYPPELRERAVRMVVEISDQHDSEWAAISEVAPTRRDRRRRARPRRGRPCATHRPLRRWTRRPGNRKAFSHLRHTADSSVDAVSRRQREFDSFPVAGVYQHESGFLALRFEHGQRLSQRGKHACAVVLHHDSGRGVDRRQRGILDRNLQSVRELRRQELLQRRRIHKPVARHGFADVRDNVERLLNPHNGKHGRRFCAMEDLGTGSLSATRWPGRRPTTRTSAVLKLGAFQAFWGPD